MAPHILTKERNDGIKAPNHKMNNKAGKKLSKFISNQVCNLSELPRDIRLLFSDQLNQKIKYNPMEENQNPPLERFGLQIRLRRKKRGLNPLEFANEAGLDLVTLTAIEYGYASLDEVCAHLERVAQGLDIPPAALSLFLKDLYRS
jgi:hypothetical protein